RQDEWRGNSENQREVKRRHIAARRGECHEMVLSPALRGTETDTLTGRSPGSRHCGLRIAGCGIEEAAQTSGSVNIIHSAIRNPQSESPTRHAFPFDVNSGLRVAFVADYSCEGSGGFAPRFPNTCGVSGCQMRTD